MNDNIIPDDVRQFILRYIESIAQLEGLLLLCRNPERKWDMTEIARGLYIDESQTITLLTRLLEQGFVIMSENAGSTVYQYHPESQELRDMVERTAELYRQYLVPITHMIHSKPRSRVQEFANAFRIRKD